MHVFIVSESNLSHAHLPVVLSIVCIAPHECLLDGCYLTSGPTAMVVVQIVTSSVGVASMCMHILYSHTLVCMVLDRPLL